MRFPVISAMLSDRERSGVYDCASVGMTASAEEAEQTVSDDIAVTAATNNSEVDSLETETENSAGGTEITMDASSVSDDDMEKFRDVMSVLAEAGTTDVAPDYDGDPYYDTDGNATLIKSEQIIYNTEEMQFIAVTTKDGHVFYVLINYTAESGEDNVYFLNKVDDYDLYALLYAGSEDDEDSSNITPEQAAEEANGRVKSDSSSDSADTVQTTESGDDTTEDGVETTPAKPSNMGNIYLALGVLALIGVGAGGFFLMKKKKGSKSAVQAENEYDDETEIVESDDDYPEYLDENRDNE